MANVKISTINTTAGYQQPVNPNADGVVANGFYPQNATSNDANAGVERDSSGNLSLKAGGSALVKVNADGTVAATLNTSTAGFSITQTGSGNALVVNDASPDTSPFVVDAGGNVGIKTSVPSYDLDAYGGNSAAIAITAAGAAPTDASLIVNVNNTTGDSYLRFGDSANYEQGRIRYNHNSDYMAFNTSQTEAMRIDNTQQLILGGAGSALSGFTYNKDGFATATYRGAGASSGGYQRFFRARGTVASPTIVNNGDTIGGFQTAGYDGVDYRVNAAIYGLVDGAPASSDMPGALSFLTATDGGITLTERLRIQENGGISYRDTLNNASTRPAVAAGTNANEIRATAATASNDDGFVRVSAGGGSSATAKAYMDLSGYSTVADMDNTIVFGTVGAERVRIAKTGTLSISAPTSGNALTAAGQIECTTTGYKFPDATTQTTSAGTIARLISPVTTTSTGFTDVTGLTLAVAAAKAYFFDAYLIWQQNNTSGGIGFAINGPASPTVLDYTIQYQNFANDAAGTIQTVHATGYDSAYTIPTTTTAANTSYIARISGVIVTGITSGTLAVRFKSNNASYTASIRAGSWLALRVGTT